MKLTAESLAAVAADKLAGAVRRYCTANMFRKVTPSYRALLAAVDDAEKQNDVPEDGRTWQDGDWVRHGIYLQSRCIIIHIASSLLRDGVELEA